MRLKMPNWTRIIGFIDAQAGIIKEDEENCHRYE